MVLISLRRDDRRWRSASGATSVDAAPYLSLALPAATLALARNLGLKVVAEGVETEAQRAFLAKHDCDLLQGYLFGKPELAAVWTERWQALKR